MSISRAQIDPDRIHEIKPGEGGPGPVLYWMNRDQRVEDNWALLYAQGLALERGVPLGVIFSVSDQLQDCSSRQARFMIEGLLEIEQRLRTRNILFALLSGSAAERLAGFVTKERLSALVTDFSPLRSHRQVKAVVADRVKAPFFEVDAHNVVPCRAVSQKLEYAAYTIRPKLHRLLPRFLVEFPRLRKHPFEWRGGVVRNDWDRIRSSGISDESLPEIEWIRPGSRAGKRVLRRFLDKRLAGYAENRNDPTEPGQSDLSPYLHFGQVSAQRVALEAERHTEDYRSRDAFLEELIVRRELSDNFCLNCERYDSFEGFPGWGQATLKEHSGDPRPYLYTVDQFERAETHDDLWNAAQLEMVLRGKMHGYLRMYWAKKILEWSLTPRDALSTAIHLNDRYELDGHDPNGYAGIAWSIGGLHDRAWSEREIFGKIRYMSYGGCRRKFDVDGYIAGINKLRKRTAR